MKLRNILIAGLILGGLAVVNIIAQDSGPKHKIYIQHTGKQSVYLKVWVDSTNLVADSIQPQPKKPGIVRIIGIADLFQYKTLTVLINGKTLRYKFKPPIIDVLINPADSTAPVRFSKDQILLKK